MKVCKFCGRQCENDTTICPSCGGSEYHNKCVNCGSLYDDGNYCPKCGVKANAKVRLCPQCGAEYYSAACPDCGYMPSKSNAVYQAAPKRRTWLWVLGWIFIFPVPLTVLMVRNRSLNKWAKVAIIAAAWLVYLAIAYSNR